MGKTKDAKKCAKEHRQLTEWLRDYKKLKIQLSDKNATFDIKDTTSDTIYRQNFDKFLEDAEIEAVKKRKYVFASALNTIRGNLRSFPSAQPEIIRCKYCKHRYTEYEKFCSEGERRSGMRLIDADALLLHLADYQLQEYPDWGANGYGNRDAYETITNCIKAVEDAPTIEPERKKGKWVVKEEDWRKQQSWHECSECGFATSRQYNFCPNCGTKMDL